MVSEDVIQKQWDEYANQCQEIYHNWVGYQKQINPQELQAAAFTGKPVVNCVDERVPGSLHCAGSFILLEGDEASHIVEKNGIEGITSHADCGAMAVVYRKEHNLPAGAPVEATTLNQFAQEQTEGLAQKLGITYAGHVDEAQMKGVPGLHNARAIYYHSTPFFNVQLVSALPPGFMISRSILSAEQALANLELCISIAFGEHGFAQRFNSETPLLIVGVYEDSGELSKEQLVQELEPALARFGSRLHLELLSVPRS